MKNKIIERANAEDWHGNDSDVSYYPLFPEEKTEKARKVYLIAHEKLMGQMRLQMRKKNKLGIEQAGKKLHRLRKRYRARFAA